MSTKIEQLKAAKAEAAAALAAAKTRTNGFHPETGGDPNWGFYQDETPATPKPFDFIWQGDLQPDLSCRDFVEDILEEDSLAVIFGPPGSGKTFWTLDLAAHVATGTPMAGKECKKGAVLYVVAEGFRGLSNRIAALRKCGRLPKDAPIAVMSTALNILDKNDAARLAETIKKVSENSPEPLRLVVLDTLARVMVGDENSNEVMGLVIAGATAVKTASGCCVLFIHHCRKDAGGKSRGGGALLGGIDTEIEVESKDDVGKVICRKQKDLAKFIPFSFSLDVVELGVNERGKPVSSCVIKYLDVSEAPAGPSESTLECTIARIRDALTINPDGMNAGSLRKLGGRGENIERALLEMQRKEAITKSPGKNNSTIYKLRTGWDPKETPTTETPAK